LPAKHSFTVVGADNIVVWNVVRTTLDDMKAMANAVKDMSDRIDLRVRKRLQPKDKEKKKTAQKSKGIAKAKPFQ
jgi:hypothetical protein